MDKKGVAAGTKNRAEQREGEEEEEEEEHFWAGTSGNGSTYNCARQKKQTEPELRCLVAAMLPLC